MAEFLTAEELVDYFLSLKYPTPLPKDFDLISQDIVDFLYAKNPNLDLRPGSGARDLMIDPVAYVAARVWQYAYDTRKAQSFLTAVGDSLDASVANYFIYRKAAVKATGYVDFIRFTPPISDIVIPVGTTISNRDSVGNDPIFFVTTQQITMLASTPGIYYDVNIGGYKITVPVQAAIAGGNGNILAGAIVVVPSGIPGITEIKNQSPTSGQTDLVDR
jgi:uncharacterized phage protein gp47/JayE